MSRLADPCHQADVAATSSHFLVETAVTRELHIKMQVESEGFENVGGHSQNDESDIGLNNEVHGKLHEQGIVSHQMHGICGKHSISRRLNRSPLSSQTLTLVIRRDLHPSQCSASVKCKFAMDN